MCGFGTVEITDNHGHPVLERTACILGRASEYESLREVSSLIWQPSQYIGLPRLRPNDIKKISHPLTHDPNSFLVYLEENKMGVKTSHILISRRTCETLCYT